MFYIKTKISESCEMHTEIHDDNIFTTCPVCGKELQVDLFEGVHDHDIDLYGAAVFCAECARKNKAIKKGPVLLSGD